MGNIKVPPSYRELGPWEKGSDGVDDVFLVPELIGRDQKGETRAVLALDSLGGAQADQSPRDHDGQSGAQVLALFHAEEEFTFQ